MKNREFEELFKDFDEAKLELDRARQELEVAKRMHEQVLAQSSREDIDLMEGFYEASIKLAEKIMNSVKVGEIINVHDQGGRYFEIVEKSSALNVKVKDIKTGRITQVYANQIEKIHNKPELLEILYEKNKK